MSSISFDQIPADVRTPGQYVEVSNARAVQGQDAHIALVIAQRLSTGTVAAATPALVPSGELGDTYFGAGSHAAEMCRAFKVANPQTQLWGIGLADAGGSVANTRTLTVTGTATADGTIVPYIGGRRVVVGVADGDVQNDIATAMDAAIKAHRDYSRMPFTSAVAANVVTLTARNKGTVTKGVDVRLNYQQGEFLPAGVGVAIAVGVAGSVDPDIQDALDVVGDVQYHTIATSLADATNAAALVTHLEAAWGAMEHRDGHGFIAVNDTLANLQTFGALFNSPFLSILEMGGLTKGSPTPNYVTAAVVAAVDARETVADPARPRQTLPLLGVLPPATGDRFTREERDTILHSGIATHKVAAGGVVEIERLITSYQETGAGVPDTSYLDITRPRTLSAMRFETRAHFLGKYPRHKLADDGKLYDPGQAVVTRSTIKAELLVLGRRWERRAWLENFDQFAADLLVTRNGSDRNRVDYRLVPDLTDGFVIGAGQIQFLP